MSEEAQPTTQPAGSGVGESNKGSKLTTILSIVNLFANLGMVAVLFISFQKDKSHPSVEDIAAKSAEEKHAEAEHGGGEHGEAKGEHGGGEHGDAKGEHGKEAKKNSNFGRTITLEQFTINLSTPGSV